MSTNWGISTRTASPRSAWVRARRGRAQLKELVLGCSAVEFPVGAFGGIQQNDASSRMPALELTGLERVVRKQKILNRMRLPPLAAAAQTGQQKRPRPALMLLA